MSYQPIPSPLPVSQSGVWTITAKVATPLFVRLSDGNRADNTLAAINDSLSSVNVALRVAVGLLVQLVAISRGRPDPLPGEEADALIDNCRNQLN